MKRLYGNALRKDAGVTKTWKGVANKQSHRAPQQVKRAVQEFHGTLERVYDDTSMAVEDFLKKCKFLPYPWRHATRLRIRIFSWTEIDGIRGEH